MLYCTLPYCHAAVVTYTKCDSGERVEDCIKIIKTKRNNKMGGISSKIIFKLRIILFIFKAKMQKILFILSK